MHVHVFRVNFSCQITCMCFHHLNNSKAPLTSFICRKSFTLKDTVCPGAGEFSSPDPSYDTFVRTANATGFVWKYTAKHTNTVKLQWLKHIWDYENLFEAGVVRAIESLLYSQARRQNRDIFSIFFNMKVYCVFSSTRRF